MTQEEINKAIAEWMGWSNIEVANSMNINSPLKGYPPTGQIIGNKKKKIIPNFYNDLNAVHEAEKRLTPEQEEQYVSWLGALIMAEAYEDTTSARWSKSNLSSTDSTYRATAPQRCEALLRTLDLWKE